MAAAWALKLNLNGVNLRHLENSSRQDNWKRPGYGNCMAAHTGPPDYRVVQHDRIALATAVFDIQKRYDISDRRLLDQT